MLIGWFGFGLPGASGACEPCGRRAFVWSEVIDRSGGDDKGLLRRFLAAMRRKTVENRARAKRPIVNSFIDPHSYTYNIPGKGITALLCCNESSGTAATQTV